MPRATRQSKLKTEIYSPFVNIKALFFERYNCQKCKQHVSLTRFQILSVLTCVYPEKWYACVS